MAKLCYKSGGTVKKYDLKDSVSSSPKLGVKVGGTTKYLGLKQGNKSGELHVKLGGQPYYVQTIMTIGNTIPHAFCYNQSARDWNHSADDERMLSWVFTNPSNNQIVAMIVYAHTEGRCQGVIQVLCDNMAEDIDITSASNINFYKQSGSIVGYRHAPSDAPVLSGNIKIASINEWRYDTLTTQQVHDNLTNPSAHDNGSLRNYRNNTKTTSKSSTGNYCISLETTGYTIYNKISQANDWWLGGAGPFRSVTIKTSSTWDNVFYAFQYNFVVGLYNGYPVIEMGSADRVRRDVFAFIEFPYSGYIGMTPYQFIDAWYEAIGDVAYNISGDSNFSRNNSIITHLDASNLIDNDNTGYAEVSLSTSMFKGVQTSTYSGTMNIVMDGRNVLMYCGSGVNGADYDIYIFFPSGVTKCQIKGTDGDYNNSGGAQVGTARTISKTITGSANSWVKINEACYNDGDSDPSYFNKISISSVAWLD